QTSSLLPISVEGVKGAPDVERLLPALNAPGVDKATKHNTLTPRVGFSYALDDSRKTQLRASYSQFASQLGAADAGFVGVVNYSYLYYFAVDRNGNQTAEFNEILFNLGLDGYYGVDINNPTSLKSFNKVNSDLNSPITNEFIVGVDREVAPNFGVSASFNYRYFKDVTWRPLIGARQSAYRQTGTLSGTEPEIGAFNVPFYAINASAVPPGGGREITNRDGYHQRYLGFELSATKRMSNRWMARLGFSTNSHNEYFDNPATSIQDPTPGPTAPLKDGGAVILRTGGSGKSQIYLILPKYQIIANGLYQGPWGINFGANYVLRQGYGQPFFQDRVAAGDPLGRKSVLLVKDVNENRLPAVHSLDVRVEKGFKVRNSNWYVDLDAFNLSNNATVLGRQFNRRLTGATGFQKTTEIMNPRVARIGLRITM
ncbi:MAG: hypothetical protein HYZ58_14525, partial [Acidobacteria bacterium]|nr:hypothetical protein [Acidobacteriota bacterium]